MSDDATYVFDTNVIISAALLRGSTPAQAFDKALKNGRVLLSVPLITELSQTLRRPKFDMYLRWEERDEFIAALVTEGVLVTPSVRITDCRDPKDNAILELAVAGNAHAVITGDDDLLCLNPFRSIPILTPAQFCEPL